MLYLNINSRAQEKKIECTDKKSELQPCHFNEVIKLLTSCFPYI